ncbi:MAG TPA: multiheme c-type cytochrome [Planctomycetota bacterium]|nr:multiheme c-type cytochrome [Planctomycetota bacterium]
MRIAALLLPAALVVAWSLASAQDGPPPEPPRTAGFVGSAACAACHPDLHARWSKTGHAVSIRDFTGKESARPFDGDIFTARNLDNKLGPGTWMECEGPGGERGRFKVEKVIGIRRVQMFVTSLPGGRLQVLPVFVEVPPRKWFDYADFIFGGPSKLEIPPDSPYSWYGPHRNFSSRCVMCHMVDYRIGYDPDKGTYETTWSEQVIGCEACHGPGAGHVEKWSRDLSVPDPIVNPVKLPIERANEVCAQCHSENLLVKPGFRPGDDLYASYDLAGLEDERHLHPDGRAKELIHNHIPTLESRCGPIRCTKCHDPHGRAGPDGMPIPGDLIRPIDDDWTCTQCHDGFKENLRAHTHHAPESAGSRCVNCHMPPLVIEGGHGRVRDHTISIPSGVNTKKLGLPNACRTCHLTEYPAWEFPYLEEWYPDADKKNHRVALAAAISAGRARQPDARDPLEKLLKDENPVYRAAAASLLAPYDVDLRPALADPHPLVRRAAIDGVARLHAEALEPLLADKSLVLRRAAAIALASRFERVSYGYVAARPELRQRVIPVLEECVRERPDDADIHYLLSRLYEMEKRREDADRALSRYKLLRPWAK